MPRVPSHHAAPMRVPQAAAQPPSAFVAMAAAHMDALGKFAQPTAAPNGTGQPALPDVSGMQNAVGD